MSNLTKTARSLRDYIYENVDLFSVSEWEQPSGKRDGYMYGDVVKHKGQTYVSTADSNVWEPGNMGWELYVN